MCRYSGEWVCAAWLFNGAAVLRAAALLSFLCSWPHQHGIVSIMSQRGTSAADHHGRRPNV